MEQWRGDDRKKAELSIPLKNRAGDLSHNSRGMWVFPATPVLLFELPFSAVYLHTRTYLPPVPPFCLAHHPTCCVQPFAPFLTA